MPLIDQGRYLKSISPYIDNGSYHDCIYAQFKITTIVGFSANLTVNYKPNRFVNQNLLNNASPYNEKFLHSPIGQH